MRKKIIDVSGKPFVVPATGAAYELREESIFGLRDMYRDYLDAGGKDSFRDFITTSFHYEYQDQL